MATAGTSVSQRVTAQARARAKSVRRGPRRASTTAIDDLGYARISDDPERKNGKQRKRGLGVARQRRECDELAERTADVGSLEWLVDNDISGGDFTDRANYDALLERISSGTVRTVVTWSLDRIGREDVEQAEFLLICEVFGVRVITCEGDDIDHSREDADGAIAMATVRNAFGSLERKKIRRRARSKQAELAQEGKPSGGKRAFCFEADGITHRPDEVALVKAAVKAISAGAHACTIASQWQADGVPTVEGGRWHPEVVKNLLLSPRMIGMRTHHGTLTKAVWKHVITEKQQEMVRAKLSGEPQGAKARVAILSGGLVRCGLCEHPLYTGQRRGVRIYRCWSQRGGCGKVTIIAEEVERIVVIAFFQRLDAIYMASRRRAKDPGDQRAQAIGVIEAEKAVLANLADLVGEKLMTPEDYRRNHAKATKRLKAAQVALSKIPDGTAIEELVATRAQLRADWDSRPVERRHQALARLLDHVPIAPAATSGPVFDRDRVQVRKAKWRA